MKQEKRAQWTNPFMFILASTGAAVGLGNIWRFPYMTGVNGGSAFVLVYMLSIVVIALPLFVAELYIGQQAQSNTVKAFELLHRKKTPWQAVGLLAVIAAVMIMSFYSVVGGWVLDFSYRSFMNEFAKTETAAFVSLLDQLFSNPYRLVFWHFVFVGLTTGIVLGGIEKGLERCNKILMPALAMILIILVIYSCFLGGFHDALVFLFKPDFSKLTAKSVLEAVGQAFFSLGLAMGIVITFGSYFSKKEKLFPVALTVSVFDTLIAVLSGIVVFSVVFTYGLKPGGGPTLIFQTLPMLFSKMPGGYVIAIAFFLLVTFAALTSSISLLEVIVTYVMETFSLCRKRATLLVGSVIFFLGMLCALSFNVLKQITIAGLTIFDFCDKITSSLFLPLGGIFTALFFGWIVMKKETGDTAQKPFKNTISLCFMWCLRLIAPLALSIILVKGLMEW